MIQVDIVTIKQCVEAEEESDYYQSTGVLRYVDNIYRVPTL